MPASRVEMEAPVANQERAASVVTGLRPRHRRCVPERLSFLCEALLLLAMVIEFEYQKV